MQIRHVLYSNKRRGMSAILGTLIFVGIIFSAFVPMYLTMKQADTLYEREMLELKRLDDERDRESMNVYVYPTEGSSSSNLTIMVNNKCEVKMRIVRVWINDTMHSMNTIVDSMSEIELGTYDVGPQNGSTYDIWVTSERGNVFESGSGPIEYIDGVWEVENKMINVLVSSSGVVFKIYVTLPGGQPHPDSPAQVWKIGGSAFKSFDITEHGNGEYNVKVKKGSKTIHDENVTMAWPNGPSVIWVYS